MSLTKQAQPLDIDITQETAEELEARGAMLVLDYPTFVAEYNPDAVDIDEDTIEWNTKEN